MRFAWEGCEALEKEFRMEAMHGEECQYTTSKQVQAWFLRRSRALWKAKYTHLKADEKRLKNRVNDVTRSRERWREESEQMTARVRELEAEVAALQQQLAALKKDGLRAAGSAG